MLSTLVILLALAFILWPYIQLKRLGEAIDENDERELRRLVDEDEIRHRLRQIVDRNIEDVTERYDNPIIRFVRGGVKELSGSALDVVDLEWVRNTLYAARRHPGGYYGSPLMGGFSFAFFESPTRFLVRAGRLGEEPIHLYMTLRNWQWRVTAVFV